MHVDPAFFEEAEKLRPEDLPVGKGDEHLRLEAANRGARILIEAHRLQHRQPEIIGGDFHRRRGHLPPAPGDGIGCGEDAHHGKARGDLSEGGNCNIGGSCKEEFHGLNQPATGVEYFRRMRSRFFSGR